MDEDKLFYIRLVILSAFFAMVYFVIDVFFGFPVIRYEIGLAVIGTIVTVLGIFIAFDLQVPTERYYKEYEAFSNKITDIKQIVSEKLKTLYSELSKGESMPMTEATNNLIKELSSISLKLYDDLFVESRKEVRSRTIVSLFGFIAIIWLILQPFVWKIDTFNQISSGYVEILIISLLFAFLWIGSKINLLYSENVTLYDRLSKRVKRMRKSVEKKYNKND
ncbi:hypothetical protein [Candidatus Borrarchaeum sp.]|uniref:hypothetical protein n=1 Tax=Candidatus Borrarchaeum sp. TaxID=2846742 RepID=UPI00257AE52F|nr:hypothetical protein [Candidatus Borrarchaeum sp.]